MSRRAKKIKLLLVDDHPLVHEGIRSSLSAHRHIRIVGEASDGMEAVKQAKKHLPDVILLDISMPQMSGLEAAHRLRSVAPKSKIIALTMHDNREYVMEMARLGASGYILKDSSPSELIHTHLSCVFPLFRSPNRLQELTIFRCPKSPAVLVFRTP